VKNGNQETETPEIDAPPQIPDTNKPATHVLIALDLLNEITRTLGEKLTWSEANPLMTRIQKEASPVNAEQATAA